MLKNQVPCIFQAMCPSLGKVVTATQASFFMRKETMQTRKTSKKISTPNMQQQKTKQKEKHQATLTPFYPPKNHNRRVRFALSKSVPIPLYVGSRNSKGPFSSSKIARKSLSTNRMPITRKEDIRSTRRAAVGSLSALAPGDTARCWSRLVTISCSRDASRCCTAETCGSRF